MKRQNKKQATIPRASEVISKEDIIKEILKNSPQKVVFIISDFDPSICPILDQARSMLNTYIVVFTPEFSDIEDVFYKTINFVDETEDYEIYLGGKDGFIELKMNRIKKILKTQKKASKKAGK